MGERDLYLDAESISSAASLPDSNSRAVLSALHELIAKMRSLEMAPTNSSKVNEGVQTSLSNHGDTFGGNATSTMDLEEQLSSMDVRCTKLERKISEIKSFVSRAESEHENMAAMNQKLEREIFSVGARCRNLCDQSDQLTKLCRQPITPKAPVSKSNVKKSEKRTASDNSDLLAYRHYRLNLTEFPFVGGGASSNSHSIYVNLQKALAAFKFHSSACTKPPIRKKVEKKKNSNCCCKCSPRKEVGKESNVSHLEEEQLCNNLINVYGGLQKELFDFESEVEGIRKQLEATSNPHLINHLSAELRILQRKIDTKKLQIDSASQFVSPDHAEQDKELPQKDHQTGNELQELLNALKMEYSDLSYELDEVSKQLKTVTNPHLSKQLSTDKKFLEQRMELKLEQIKNMTNFIFGSPKSSTQKAALTIEKSSPISTKRGDPLLFNSGKRNSDFSRNTKKSHKSLHRSKSLNHPLNNTCTPLKSVPKASPRSQQNPATKVKSFLKKDDISWN